MKLNRTFLDRLETNRNRRFSSLKNNEIKVIDKELVKGDDYYLKLIKRSTESKKFCFSETPNLEKYKSISEPLDNLIEKPSDVFNFEEPDINNDEYEVIDITGININLLTGFEVIELIKKKGGIYRMPMDDEIVEYIDLCLKLEKAINNKIDKNWFVYKVDGVTQKFGKADLLLCNSETKEYVTIQLKLKDNPMNDKELAILLELYRNTDLIFVGFKTNESFLKQKKVIEETSLVLSDKLHFIDLSPYYDNTLFFKFDSIIDIINKSKFNNNRGLDFEEVYTKTFNKQFHWDKKARTVLWDSWDKDEDEINLNDKDKPNIIVDTVSKNINICAEFNLMSVEESPVNIKSEINKSLNENKEKKK